MTEIAPGHAAERALQRYGVVLTVADFRQIMLDIIDTVAGDRRAAILQERRPDGSEWWLVSCRGVSLRVAYNPVNARVMSALPWRRGARC